MTRYILIAISLLLAASQFWLARQLQIFRPDHADRRHSRRPGLCILPAGAGYVMPWLVMSASGYRRIEDINASARATQAPDYRGP